MRRETDSLNWGGKRPGAGRKPASPGSTIHTIKCNNFEWLKVQTLIKESRKESALRKMQEKLKKSDPLYSWDSRYALNAHWHHAVPKKSSIDEYFNNL